MQAQFAQIQLHSSFLPRTAALSRTGYLRSPAARLPTEFQLNKKNALRRNFDKFPGRVEGQGAAGATQASDSRSVRASAAAKSTVAEPQEYDCVVVGAGIFGLCTAFALSQQKNEKGENFKVLVTEGRERVGGNITTVQSEDGKYLWEEGPNSFQPNDSILKCVVDADLKDELVLGDPDAPRFVFWQEKLRPVPAGPLDLPVFDLMSIMGKIRAGLGAIGLRPPPPQGKEESVEEFVRRNLGDEVFERLIEPFCSGVYAGDPSRLSMKAAFGRVWRLEEIGGSIIGGVLKLIQEKRNNPPPPRDERLPKPKGQTVGSFKKGLITLPNGIARKLGSDSIRLNSSLSAIEKRPDSTYSLSFSPTPSSPPSFSVVAKSVVLTAPAYTAAELLKPFSSSASEALSSFFYPPVAAVTLCYPFSALRKERLNERGEFVGFGQLHPRSQGITTLGTIYSSSLFPNRCPADEVLLLCYIGGATNQGIATQGVESIVNTVDKDLRRMLLSPDAPPPNPLGVRVWQRAIPQFQIGHLDKLQTAKDGLKAAGLHGVFLGGNYAYGVALGRCVEGGYEMAKDVIEHLTVVQKNA